MFAYRTPGVRVEWRDRESRGGELWRGDIAGFVGIAARGPLHTPVLVESWDQFTRLFGAHIPQAYLAYAVAGFFANGGRACYVVRVADPELALAAICDLRDAQGQPCLRLEASNPGVWGDQLEARVPLSGNDGSFDLALTLPDGTREFWHDLSIYSATLDLPNKDGQPVLRLLACAPALWEPYRPRAWDSTELWPGQERTLLAHVSDDRDTLTLAIGAGSSTRRQETYHGIGAGRGAVVERLNRESQLARAQIIRKADLRPGAYVARPNPRFVASVLNNPQRGSLLANAVPAPGMPAQPPAIAAYRLANGADGLAPGLTLLDTAKQPRLRLIARDPQREVKVKLIAGDDPQLGGRLEVYADGDGTPTEVWERLTLRSIESALQPAAAALNSHHAGSQLVMAVMLPPDPQASGAEQSDELQALDRTALAGGLAIKHFIGSADPALPKTGLRALELRPMVGLVAIPDAMPAPYLPPPPTNQPAQDCADLKAAPAPRPIRARPPEFARQLTADDTASIQDNLIAHCMQMGTRMALLDPRPEDRGPVQVLAWRQRFDSSYAALYYPWLMVPDPLRGKGLLRAVPPCGHVAGVYARVERQAGVHWPPANQELDGVLDLATSYANAVDASDVQQTVAISDLIHGDLNEAQVNAIRSYPGRGIRVFGARTLSAERAYRYINVRRLLCLIVAMIERRTQWAVFEPNDTALWRDLERVIRGLLDDLWRRGMLDGASADRAYKVTCNEQTNPPEEIDLGRVVCRVELLPPEPAEFVVVRIGRSQSGVAIIEQAEADNGRYR